MNAPRMTSSPSSPASATSPISSTNAARTRIWAVVSCRRRSVVPMRIECSARRITSATSAAATNRPTSRMTFVAVLEASREKKSESRMTVAKSAIVPPAITSCPKVVPLSPRP